MARPKHNCSKRIFTGERNDFDGHMCSTPATILEDSKWWCKRHTKEGQARRKTKSDERTRTFLEGINKDIAQHEEMRRRSRLFPKMLKALEEIIEARDNYHGGDLARAVDKARPIVKSAITNRDPVE
jgi:hypothetical protein